MKKNHLFSLLSIIVKFIFSLLYYTDLIIVVANILNIFICGRTTLGQQNKNGLSCCFHMRTVSAD